MTRAARRLMRRSSVASTSGSPVSQPSESTITIVRRSTSRPHSRLNSASDLDREPQHLGELIGCERREVLAHEALLVGHRRHAERLALVVAAVIVAPGVERQRLALLTRPRYRKRFLRAEAGRGQAGDLRLAEVSESPERVEAAVEDRCFLGPGDEDGAEPEIQLVTIGDVEMIEGADGIDDLDDRDGQRLCAEERRKA